MHLTIVEENILTLLKAKDLTGHQIKDALHFIYELEEGILNGSLWPHFSRLIAKDYILVSKAKPEIFTISDEGLEALAITEKSRLRLQELLEGIK
jgi:DNA-binding PadR family transcriptional regulator